MAYNLFDSILKMVNPETKQAFSQAGQAISKTFSPLAPVAQWISQWANQVSQAFKPAIETAKSTVQPISTAIWNVAQPVVEWLKFDNRVTAYKKPYQDKLTKLGITAQTLDDMGLSDDEKQAVKDLYSQVWVEIPWLAQMEQAKVQSDKIKSEDWLSQKSYFWDQRPNEWVIEQAGKWVIRTPLTYAQNAISWPENIAQGSLNLLDKTLWEWVLNPLLNVAWSAIKWDKYNPLPTLYNNVPSTNQYTENVASNIFGAGKEALTTNKSYSQANEELKQQQYKAGKDQWIGGSLANIGGGAVSSAFNIMAPWASALFAWASEMPWTQYVTQWLGALTQAPIDYAVSKSGGTEETANQIGTMANLALPLARNKVAWMKPTSTPGKLLQKTVVTTADAIINPLWAIKDAWTAVFSKNPRSVEDIAGNILQPYKWMTENLEDATAWVRRVVEETGTKTSTYDGLLTAIKNTQNKYGKMLSDSLGQITTSTKSQLFDTALTQLAKIYEWVSSPKFKAIQERINELWKKNVTTGLTPAEKNEVKILHTKSNNLFNEKWQQTGWFSSDDLRALRQDLVAEINKEASDAWITNVADINKAYWELSDARTLAENQVANLKAYKGRTPPPTTMAKITNMIVDFPIIKQVFSDPTRAVASALFKNLRWDKINPIEVQGRLSGFLKELKKAGAKAEELKKIEQIMLSMKLLPEKSSAKIPLTQTEQDKAIIKQSKPSNITKNGNLDNSVPTPNNNMTKSIKKPVSKPLIKNESKVNKPTTGNTIPEGYFKNAFWEIIKKPSNKKGGFIKIPEIGKKVEPLSDKIKKWKVIWEWSDRKVIDLLNWTVVKIPKNERWIMQMDVNYNDLSNKWLIPKVIEKWKWYVIFEKVDNWWKLVDSMLKEINQTNYDRKKIQSILNNYWYKIDSLDWITINELLNKNNWGLKNWKPIIIDEWIFNNERIFNKWRNLSEIEENIKYIKWKQKEFKDFKKLDIYNQSKSIPVKNPLVKPKK